MTSTTNPLHAPIGLTMPDQSHQSRGYRQVSDDEHPSSSATVYLAEPSTPTINTRPTGYASANITIHASIYNPNRFNIELKRLHLTFFYKNELFGHGSISHNQLGEHVGISPPTATATEPLWEREQEQQSTRRSQDDLDNTTFFGSDLPPAQQLDNNLSTAYPSPALSHYDDWGSINPILPSISPQLMTTLLHSFLPSMSRDGGNSRNGLYSAPPIITRPQIMLSSGSITDIFLDAIFEPTMKQAVDMAADYSTSNLFVSVKVEYDTSVFAWYTPRINYNATSQFDNIDIAGGGAHGDGEENFCLCQAQPPL